MDEVMMYEDARLIMLACNWRRSVWFIAGVALAGDAPKGFGEEGELVFERASG